LTIQVYTPPYSHFFACIFLLALSSSLKVNEIQSKKKKLRKTQNKGQLGIEEEEKKKIK
jgi:hypothetical protein